jgi:hypothetical protein
VTDSEVNRKLRNPSLKTGSPFASWLRSGNRTGQGQPLRICFCRRRKYLYKATIPFWKNQRIELNGNRAH